MIKTEKDENGHTKYNDKGLPILTEGSRIGLVYGQMNEPPGARMRVALSALAVTEYFGMKRVKTCCSSWTTSSVFLRPVPR